MKEEESVIKQLQKLQTDLLEKFEELKSDNEKFKLRLQKIEEKLGIDIETEHKNIEEIEKEEETKENEEIENKENNNEEETYDDELEEEEEEEHEALTEPEDEGKPEVKLEKLPTSTFRGFCFRPLAGWRNSLGRTFKYYCESHDDRVFLEPGSVLRELRTRDEVQCS